MPASAGMTVLRNVIPAEAGIQFMVQLPAHRAGHLSFNLKTISSRIKRGEFKRMPFIRVPR
jgi:hypothetical protein